MISLQVTIVGLVITCALALALSWRKLINSPREPEFAEWMETTMLGARIGLVMVVSAIPWTVLYLM